MSKILGRLISWLKSDVSLGKEELIWERRRKERLYRKRAHCWRGMCQSWPHWALPPPVSCLLGAWQLKMKVREPRLRHAREEAILSLGKDRQSAIPTLRSTGDGWREESTALLPRPPCWMDWFSSKAWGEEEQRVRHWQQHLPEKQEWQGLAREHAEASLSLSRTHIDYHWDQDCLQK